MPSRLCALLLFATLAASAASKKPIGTASGENDDLILTVTLHNDAEELKQLVGSDLGGHYVVAEVKVQPKYGKTVTVDRDDFVLRSNKDYDTSRPFEASQVAGADAIVVTRTRNTSTADATQPDYGGVPRMGGPLGYPRNNPGVGGGGAPGDFDVNKATVKESGKTGESPLEKTLDAKILPDKKTDQPLSGLLYFALEKQKLKDLDLVYGGKENRITLRFNGK
jgi:hypothetical protein